MFIGPRHITDEFPYLFRDHIWTQEQNTGMSFIPLKRNKERPQAFLRVFLAYKILFLYKEKLSHKSEKGAEPAS